MENKKIIVLLMVFTIIFTIAGGTLAYWNWSSSEAQKTNVVFTATSNFSCAADGGGNITEADTSLAPASCTNSTYAIKRTVKVSPTIKASGLNINMDLWLDVNSLGTGLSNSQNFRYALTTSSTSCETGVISSGNFNGEAAGGKINILSKTFNTTTTDTYYLYIWLDKEETSTETMNQTFSLSINGSCNDAPRPEKPVLDSGMIPVTISDTGVTSTVSKENHSWYNYSNKEWANAILVKSESRSKYLNTNGKVVNPDDILAYYVWIPRYRYKLWMTYDNIGVYHPPHTISIVFEDKDTPKSLGATPGSYRTHPAFTFGDEELNGIWVGKFETTKTNGNLTVLPNILETGLGYYGSAYGHFTSSLVFSGGELLNGNVTFSGNDTYGLSANTDSHMAKNSEWGAVAYLSHSDYGINRNIRLNNYKSSDFEAMTGCGLLSETNPNPTVCEMAYGSDIHEYPQSTTGNITGIYDMAGGEEELVMGMFAEFDLDEQGIIVPGTVKIYTGNGSYFKGLNADGSENPYTHDLPNSKYYEFYNGFPYNWQDSTVIYPDCGDGENACFGHALEEVYGWYAVSGDTGSMMVYPETPWFIRGGSGGHDTFYEDLSYPGIFKSDSTISEVTTFRSVLVPTNS